MIKEANNICCVYSNSRSNNIIFSQLLTLSLLTILRAFRCSNALPGSVLLAQMCFLLLSLLGKTWIDLFLPFFATNSSVSQIQIVKWIQAASSGFMPCGFSFRLNVSQILKSSTALFQIGGTNFRARKKCYPKTSSGAC